MKYKFPLQTDNFSFWDRLKVCSFILNKKNRLTSGPKVEEFEKLWSDFSGSATIATSSGSTANHLLVEVFLQTHNLNPQNITVFCPSTTWASSVSPWIMRGCEVVFVDINLQDFSFDYDKLDQELLKREKDGKVKVIWPTALIGFIPDVNRLKEFKEVYNTYLFADLCETSLGWFKDQNILNCFDMTTTSFFWAHEFTSIEGGMLFIRNSLRNEELTNNAKMIRSHGMIRVLPEHDFNRQKIERENKHIDPEFLFEKLGTNYRLTDLNAKFGLIDSKRLYKYCKFRRKIWRYFLKKITSLNGDEFKIQYRVFNEDIIPFCLPIIKQAFGREISETKKILNKNGWETRPIISFLPINPAFRYLSEGENKYPNSKYLHENGFYVGLNKDLKEKDIDKLISLL